MWKLMAHRPKRTLRHLAGRHELQIHLLVLLSSHLSGHHVHEVHQRVLLLLVVVHN